LDTLAYIKYLRDANLVAVQVGETETRGRRNKRKMKRILVKRKAYDLRSWLD